jgi:hypothetical protein
LVPEYATACGWLDRKVVLMRAKNRHYLG